MHYILIIILNIFMPVICWAPLAKSAQDATTIAEYISGRILNHDLNPSAHGLDGYAVFNHRDASILDHPDYSIISDKITANQIIGKDFRTDYNVGPNVSGVKFNKDALEMWDEGKQKVYIPKSGDPVFQGKLKIAEIQYLATYVRTTFESVGQWITDNGSWTTFFNPFMGNACLTTDAGWYGIASVRSENSWLDMNKNPIFEQGVTNVGSAHNFFYFGLGCGGDFQPDIDFVGFQHAQDKSRALMLRQNNWYWYQIHGVDNSKKSIWRVEIDKNRGKVVFKINDFVYFEGNDPGLSEITDNLFSYYLMTTYQYKSSVDMHFLALGELLL